MTKHSSDSHQEAQVLGWHPSTGASDGSLVGIFVSLVGIFQSQCVPRLIAIKRANGQIEREGGKPGNPEPAHAQPVLPNRKNTMLPRHKPHVDWEFVPTPNTADEGAWLARLTAVAAQARLRCGIGKLARGIDYTDEDVHFMKALDCYKRRHHRPFPTCCEVLEVLRSLGYTKVS